MAELWFTNQKSKDKKLIQYIFKKWEKHLRNTDELEVSNITLEHIVPQSTNDSNLQKRVGQLGNLLPLSGKINNNIGNTNFVNKIEKFKDSELNIVKEFVANNESKHDWTDSDIISRTFEMADIAYNKIWKF